MIVVDTSLALQWLLPEPDSQEAEALLGREDLVAPDILLIEAANVLSKKVRQGEIDGEQAREGVRFLTANVPRLLPTAELVSRALDIAIEISHPVYDCVFLACAEAISGVVATRDVRLANRARRAGLGALVRDPGGWKA